MIFKPPPICRQCETPLVVEPIGACCQLAAIAADRALDLNKAERRAAEDQAQAMRLQHRYQSTEYA
jgi:hypothetical protein